MINTTTKNPVINSCENKGPFMPPAKRKVGNNIKRELLKNAFMFFSKLLIENVKEIVKLNKKGYPIE